MFKKPQVKKGNLFTLSYFYYNKLGFGITSITCKKGEFLSLKQHLTWWVTSPLRWDGEEGVYDCRPLLEESGDHLQPLWPQELKQLKEEH